MYLPGDIEFDIQTMQLIQCDITIPRFRIIPTFLRYPVFLNKGTAEFIDVVSCAIVTKEERQ